MESQAHAAPSSHGRLLVVAADHDRASRFCAEVAPRHRCICVTPGRVSQRTAQDAFRINLADRAQWETLRSELLEDWPLPSAAVYLQSSDARPSDAPTGSELQQRITRDAQTLAEFVRFCSEWPDPPLKLWLVTEGAFSVAGEPPLAFPSASLWGLGQVAALEHPEIWGGAIDLPFGCRPESAANSVLAEISAADHASRTAFRDERRYVQVLERASLPSNGHFSWPEGVIVITGGRGILGINTAQWLAKNGVQKLALVSRSSRASKDVQARIATLRASGVRVEEFSADVSSEAQLRSAFDAIEQDLGAITGVIHAAGVISHARVSELTPDAFDSVLAAKVAGAWNLHRITLGRKLACFVCFSSATSVWGAAESGAYAAGNAFLDSLAHYRHALGLPATAVNWASLAAGGMASDEYMRYMQERGIQPLPDDKALGTLDAVLAQGVPQATVADVNWDVFLGIYEARQSCSLFDRLRPSNTAGGNAQPEPRTHYAELDAEARETAIENLIRSEVADILGICTADAAEIGPNKSFFKLGMDSLATVKLCRRLESRLGLRVPPASVFAKPTVKTLAGHICLGFDQQLPVPAAAPPAPSIESGIARAPLTSAQERLWFLDRILSNPSAYNVHLTVEMDGELDTEVLRQSIARLVADHDQLRATFPEVSGEPEQRILPETNWSMALLDLTHLKGEQLRQECEQLQSEHAQRHFDLEHGPLFRTLILKIAPDRSLLFLTQHHIVTDGWSINLLLQKLAETYTAILSTGVTPSELAPRYADFAARAASRRKKEELEADRTFWRDRLAGLSHLRLPWDRPEADESCEGGVTRFTIPADTFAVLCNIGQEHDCTPFMVLLAVFAALMHRYSRQSDFGIGTVRANRDSDDTKALVGLLTNTEVWRFDFSRNPSFIDVLQREHLVAAEAFGHSSLPYADVVSAANPDRTGSENPLFRVCFTQQLPLRSFVVPGGKWTCRPATLDGSPPGVVKFDLQMCVAGDGQEAEIHYRKSLLNDSAADRLAAHFLKLAVEIAAHPEEPVSAYLLLSELEEGALAARNRTGRSFSLPQCVHRAFEEVCNQMPAATAVRCEGKELTYEELNHRANQLAWSLLDSGVRPGSVVGLCVERSEEIPIALLGILKAGCAYLPLDPDYPSARLAYMVEHSRASLLVTSGNIPAGLSERGQVIDLRSDEKAICAHDTRTPDLASTHPNDLAYVIYTSGSSGKPKGVCISHGALMNALCSLGEEIEFSGRDEFLAATSLSFDIAALEQFLPLIRGGCIHIAPRKALDSLRILTSLLDDPEVTVAQATPTLWRMVLDTGWTPRSGLRILCGGEALSPDLAGRLRTPSVRCWNLYGPTETTIWSTIWNVPEDCDSVLIGRPLANTQVYVVDEQMQLVPDDVVGELCIGGTGLSNGYLSRPDLTAASFMPNPFSTVPGSRLYCTGDRVRWLTSGQLEYLGRTDSQIKIHGHRIELGEIENELRGLPGVKNAAVILRDDVPENQALVAYVVCERFDPSVERKLHTSLSRRLPAYMIPAYFVAMSGLPLTPNRKLDRKRLPPPPPRSNTQSHATSTSGLEELIAGAWREVLGIDAVRYDQTVFDLGGTSLALIRIQRCLERELGFSLNPVDLLNYPTISSFASLLSKNATENVAPRADSTTEDDRDGLSPIAIVGIGCRFPGATDPSSFWDLLANDRDTVGEVPPERWDLDRYYTPEPARPGRMYVRSAGIVPNIDMFDSKFFGFTSEEARLTDPQHRLLMEVTWEALDDAGIQAEALRNTRAGVFVGISGADYSARTFWQESDQASGWAGLGSSESLAAGRISHRLGASGPSLVVNTACSSSLVAVHLACESLRRKESALALAGGVNLVLDPRPSIALCQLGALSPSGRCRPFGREADGYVRSDGCGIVVLKRLCDAEANGDHIIAVIRGSATNHDGGGASLTAPNGLAQEAVILEALRNADISADDIDYVEAHGTGTQLGDPVEIQALSRAYCINRTSESPLWVGSVKSNIGHAEAAAGVAGLIKTALALSNHELPASLHCSELNPIVPWSNIPIRVPTTRMPWPRNTAPFRAAVSSFGISGTNAHVVLESAPARTSETHQSAWRPFVLALSAHTHGTLETRLSQIAEYIRQHPEIPIADICAKASSIRSLLPDRIALLVSSSAEMMKAIEDALAGRIVPSVFRARADATRTPTPRIRFWYPESLPHPPDWQNNLYNTEPIYREVVEKFNSVLELHSSQRLCPRAIDIESCSTQISRFASVYALHTLLRSWGIRPDVLVGDVTALLVAALDGEIVGISDAVDLLVGRTSRGFDLSTCRQRLAANPEVVLPDDVTCLRDDPRGHTDAYVDVVWDSDPILGASSFSSIHLFSEEQSFDSPLLNCLANCYSRGVNLEFSRIFKYRPLNLALPAYPLERQSYWVKLADSRHHAVEADCEPRQSDSGLLYQSVWRDKVPPPISERDTGTAWVIISDTEDAAYPLTLAFRNADTICHVLCAASPEDAATELKRLLQSSHFQIRGIVYIATRPATWPDELSALEFGQECYRATSRAICLFRAAQESSSLIPFWMFTVRAVAAGDSDRGPLNVAQSALWGLGAAMEQEFPDRFGGLVDLADGEDAKIYDLAVAHLLASDQETFVALRDGRRYVRRIAHFHPTEPTLPCCSPSATYMVTGGLGYLGLETARLLADQGARFIVLVSRKELLSQVVSERIAAIKRAGAEVAVIAADVSDEEALSLVPERWPRHFPALRGIVHAAGISCPAALNSITSQDVIDGLAAKTTGAWALHRLSRRYELDFFVCFSSAAAVWGSNLSSVYSAGNAVLDGVVAYRRQLGLCALSVNWGPWAGGGMGEAAEITYRQIGLALLEPRLALSSLRSLIGSSATQAICASVDWPRFKAIYESRPGRRLFQEIASGEVEAVSSFLTEGQALPNDSSEQCRPELVEWLRQQIADLLEVEPITVKEDVGFFEMGLDSLSVLELRDRLSAQLSINISQSALFNYPTLTALAQVCGSDVKGGIRSLPKSPTT